MCGIAGYIGQSKKPKVTYELITHLFDYLEMRGTDAAGVWGTEQGKDGCVIYHKEPIKSSEFIKKDFWKQLRKMKTNMLLVHARATSRGNGHARHNQNNHPFVSSDKRIGMIHNGTIEEASFLKEKYQILSSTDSEVLLRMYEHGLEETALEIKDGNGVAPDIAERMNGVKDIWSVISKGAMAVAFGERIDDHTRYLFLFRNSQRPLWIADLRDVLGQVFFFSSPEIWYRAVASSDNLKDVCSGTEKLIEVPTKQVWFFKIDERNPSMNGSSEFFRFNMEVSDKGEKWKSDGLKVVKAPKHDLDVLTHLDDYEELATDTQPSRSLVQYDPDNYDEPFPGAELSCQGGTEHENVCKQITDLANSIEISANNSVMEGSMNPHDYMELLEMLEQIRTDLEGTLRIVEH